MLFDDKRQKSLKRRFLLILGVTTLLAVFALGLMVIFWDSMLPNISKTQRIIIGLVLIGYGILRFSRILKKEPDEE
jgi:cytochrome c biogenesis protein CcdA